MRVRVQGPEHGERGIDLSARHGPPGWREEPSIGAALSGRAAAADAWHRTPPSRPQRRGHSTPRRRTVPCPKSGARGATSTRSTACAIGCPNGRGS